MTKVKVFVYGRRRQQRHRRRRRRGYDNSSPDFRHGELKRGITHSKIDANWRHRNMICSTSKQSNVQNFRSIYQSR